MTELSIINKQHIFKNGNIIQMVNFNNENKEILEPMQFTHKKIQWLKMVNIENNFKKKKMKDLLLSYNKITSLLSNDILLREEFNKYKSQYFCVSPLLHCFNNETDNIRCKINIKKKFKNGNTYPLCLFSHMPVNDLCNFIKNNNNDCYEILHNMRKRKVYFDFDKKVENKIDNIVECDEYRKLIEQIKSIFVNCNLSISGSCGYKKKIKSYELSLHIIINNYHFSNLEHMKSSQIKKLAFILDTDPIPYNSNQCFKLPNQSKMEDKKNPERIQKILIDENYDNHIIQNINNKSILITDQIKNYLIKNDTTFKIGNTIINKTTTNNKRTHLKFQGTFNKYDKLENVPIPNIHHYHDDIRTILKCIPFDKVYIKYKEFYFIITCCCNEGLDFDEMWEIIYTQQRKNIEHDKCYWKEIYNKKMNIMGDFSKKQIKNHRKLKRKKLFGLLEQFYGPFENKYVKKFKTYELDNKNLIKLLKLNF